MPSALAIPTVEDYRRAFHSGVQAKRDRRSDGHTGAVYDYVAGTTAMLLARESAYLRDLFRGGYFDTADGDALTEIVAQRFRIDRVKDGPGTGFLTLRRRTAAAGADTAWKGSRIRVLGGAAANGVYAVAKDTLISATATIVPAIPVVATKNGPGTAFSSNITGLPCALDDALLDPTWEVASLSCSDGTAFEPAAEFRARVRSTIRESVVGYVPAIVLACNGIGAANVSCFDTNFGGSDLHGVAVYVGDASFNGTDDMVYDAILALESKRILGIDLLVGKMVATPLGIATTIQLHDDPGLFDLRHLSDAIEGAIRRVFGSTSAYGYDLDALFGAIVDVTDAVQGATFMTPTSSQGLLVGSPPWFPQTMPRYFIPPNQVNFTFVGP